MKKRKGFTLIELLVVIAIIGILASIVLVSLRGATTKAKDAKIISDLEQVRNLAELIYNSETSYVKLCDQANHVLDDDSTDADSDGTEPDTEYDKQLGSLKNDVKVTYGGPSGTVDATCYSNGDKYCVYMPLLSKRGTSSKWYCIDSTGKAGETTTDPSGTCDGTTFTCP